MMNTEPHKHLTPEYISVYMKKLGWLDNQPIPQITVSENIVSNRRKVSAFHNRITTSSHL